MLYCGLISIREVVSRFGNRFIMELCMECEPWEIRVRGWLECVTPQEPLESECDSKEISRSTCSENSVVQSPRCITNRKSKKIPRNIYPKTLVSDSDSICRSSTSYRRSYTFEEGNAIIRYIISNDVFSFLKGNLLWKKMEMDEVCHRSWQSMKAQFIRNIIPNLGTYCLNETDKEKFIEYMKPSIQKKSVSLEPGQRGWRRNGNYYSASEDKVIINYVLQKKRYLRVHGNSVWQSMEDEKILPDRSWQSMRSRYLNFIVRDLEQYKLKNCDVRKLTRRKNDPASKKMQQNLPVEKFESLHKRSNIVDTVNKQKKQDIRRHALTASVYLAANLGMSKMIRQISEIKSVTNPKLLAEGSVCPDSQLCVKNDKTIRNCAITEAKHEMSNSPVHSSKRDDLTVPSECEDKICDHIESINSCNKCQININEEVPNIQTTADSTKVTCVTDNSRNIATCETIEDDVLRENEQICVSEKEKDMSEITEHNSESSLLYLGKPRHRNSANDSAIDVNGKEDSLQETNESNTPDQRVEDIYNGPNAQKVSNDNLKVQICAADAVDTTTTTNPEICQTENCIPRGKVQKTYCEDQNDIATCDEHSICSERTIVCHYNSNLQSESASSILPTRPCYQDDMIKQTKCSYSLLTIRNCEKCSAQHKLSPCSN